MQTLGPKSNPSKVFGTIFLSAKVLPLTKISAEWARNSVFWLNFLEVLDYINNRRICLALPYVAPLVKDLFKFHHI